MQRRLPERIQPYKACERGLVLEGECPLAALTRLSSMIHEPKGGVSAALKFGFDEENNPVISGHAEGELILQCQRCLQPFAFPMRVVIQLALVRSAREGERSTSAYEPLIADSDDVSLYELIEDELILNLPVVARHADDQCLSQVEPAWHADVAAEPKRENPFEVLKKLKTKPAGN